MENSEASIFTVSVTGVDDARLFSLGGWSLDIQNYLDMNSRALYYGDGTTRETTPNDRDLSLFAGGGSGNNSGLGGPATQAGVEKPSSLTKTSDGSIYIGAGNLIKRVDPNGIISNFAGGGSSTADGISALQAQLPYVEALASDSSGNIFLSGYNANSLRKVDTNGIITTVAGGGSLSDTTAPILATTASLNGISSISIAHDGTTYLSTNDGLIHRITTDGKIFQFQTTPTLYAARLAVSSDGGIIYVSTYGSLYGVSPGGTAHLIFSASTITSIAALQLDANDNVFLGTIAGRIYKVIANSPILVPLPRDFSTLRDLTIAPNQSILVAETSSNIISKIDNIFPAASGVNVAIPSSDASQIYDFNPIGMQMDAKDALTNAILYQFSYDTNGRLASIADRDANLTKIIRDASGNPTQIISPYGVITTLTSDTSGHLLSVSDPIGNTHQISYRTGTGLLSSFTSPKGLTSQMGYDLLNRLASDTNAVNGKQTLVRTEVPTIQSGSTITVTHTDQMGLSDIFTTDYALDGTQTTQTTFADQSTSSNSYPPTGTTSGVSTNLSRTIASFADDPRFGKQSSYASNTEIDRPLGNIVDKYNLAKQISYSSSTNTDGTHPFVLTQTSSFNSKYSTSTFDSSTRKITLTSPEGRGSSSVLDSKSRVVNSTVNGLSPVSFQYDSKGRLSSTTQGSRSSSFTYDSNGNLQSTTNAIGQKNSFLFDGAGRVTSQILPDSRQIKYSYDANSNLISVTPPGKPAYLFNFNFLDLLSNYTAPSDGGPTSSQYQYDLAGKLTQITRPDGQLITYSYNSYGQLVSISSPSFGSKIYSYLATGQLGQVSVPLVDGQTQIVAMESSSFSYNGAAYYRDTFSGPFNGLSGVHRISDDANGGVYQRYAIIGKSGYIYHQYKNDRDGLLTGVGLQDQSGNYVSLASYQRDPNNGLILSSHFVSLNYKTPLSGSGIQIDDSYNYNSFGELTHFESNNFFSEDISRDAIGRISQKSENVNGTSHSYAYTYDPAGRLTNVATDGQTSSQYSYDSNSNRISAVLGASSVSATYDSQDRILTYGTKAYTYSGNSEVTSVTDSSNSQSIGFKYDVFGNLVHSELPNGDKVDYLVDGQGLRIGKKSNGQYKFAFAYDANNRLSMSSDYLTYVSEFIYAGHSTPQFLIKLTAGLPSKTYRIISDERGSVRQVIDGDSGTIVQRIDYDEFGNVTNDTNPGFQPFGYAGGLYDSDTKLVHFGARDYDPETGRFISKDPTLFNGGSTNLYSYTLNDPINFIDPSGDFAIEIGTGFLSQIGLLGGGASKSLAFSFNFSTGLWQVGTTTSVQGNIGGGLYGGGGLQATISPFAGSLCSLEGSSVGVGGAAGTGVAGGSAQLTVGSGGPSLTLSGLPYTGAGAGVAGYGVYSNTSVNITNQGNAYSWLKSALGF